MCIRDRNYTEEELNRVIAQRKSWPVLYHFSHIRQNIVQWLPITKSHKVLEIGSGCGAVTGALARLAGDVTCIEPVSYTHLDVYKRQPRYGWQLPRGERRSA